MTGVGLRTTNPDRTEFSSLSGFSDFRQIRFDSKNHNDPNGRYNLSPAFRYGKLGELSCVRINGNESEAVVILKWFQSLSGILLPTHASPAKLLQQYQRQRTSLQRQYFELASSTGLPRGLRWLSCDWLEAHVLLRDRTTKQPNLLVSINLRFEAIEGSDMEDVAAVSSIRDACAVFQWQNNAWTTSGRTLFNMNPEVARQRLAASYEPI